MRLDSQKTAAVGVSGQAETCHCVLDSLVRVKSRGNSVVVRLKRDNFSAEAKTSLIKHLALAGFIPDRYQWYCENSGFLGLEVKWVTGGSWSRISEWIKRN